MTVRMTAREYTRRRKAERDEAVALSGKGWQHIGDFGVDTATIAICDPCNAYEIGGAGWDGVLIPSGEGDGVYPVFARYENGVCAEVRIMFVEGEKPKP
jgi:hypothetical protein